MPPLFQPTMDTTNQTIYITKYATTKGILELPGELKTYDGYSLWKGYGDSYSNGYRLFSYKDGFLNKEDAIADACKRRDNKIKSLRKQLEKLENMTF